MCLFKYKLHCLSPIIQIKLDLLSYHSLLCLIYWQIQFHSHPFNSCLVMPRFTYSTHKTVFHMLLVELWPPKYVHILSPRTCTVTLYNRRDLQVWLHEVSWDEEAILHYLGWPDLITRVFIKWVRRLKQVVEDVTTEARGWSDERKALWAKEYRQLLEAKIGKETDSS